MSEQLPDVYLQSDVINHVVHSVNPNKTRRTVHCSMSFYEPNVDQRNDTRYTPHSKLQEAEDRNKQLKELLNEAVTALLDKQAGTQRNLIGRILRSTTNE